MAARTPRPRIGDWSLLAFELRRGFQQVKRIDRIEIHRRRDAGQWLAVLVSGLE